MFGICKNCGKEKNVSGSGKIEGLCNVCYRKLIWQPKKLICKRCGREKPIHAKGLCDGCYNSVFYIEKVKEQNMIKSHNIDKEKYRKITANCIICGFGKIIDLHHIDNNHKNNTDSDLVGLCPNHHKMIHDRRFRKEIESILKDKGYNVPETYKDDEFFKNPPS